jgi:hypothetical protein
MTLCFKGRLAFLGGQNEIGNPGTNRVLQRGSIAFIKFVGNRPLQASSNK